MIAEYYDHLLSKSEEIVVRLNLKAVSKGRPRFGQGHAFTPAKTREYEEQVRQVAVAKMKGKIPLSYPVRVVVVINEAVPVSYSKVDQDLAMLGLIVPQRGDLDNKVKAITDALNGVVYHDDSQISFLIASKRYDDKDSITVSILRAGMSSSEVDTIKKRLKASHVNDSGRSSDLGETRNSGVPVRPEQGTTH